MARPCGPLIIFITLPFPPDRCHAIRFDSSANSYMEFPADKKNAHKGHWNLCPEFMPLRIMFPRSDFPIFRFPRSLLCCPGLIICRWNAASCAIFSTSIRSCGYRDNELWRSFPGGKRTYGNRRGWVEVKCWFNLIAANANAVSQVGKVTQVSPWAKLIYANYSFCD